MLFVLKSPKQDFVFVRTANGCDAPFAHLYPQVVGTMRTAEEFWQLQQLLSPPSSLPAGVDLALFRAGVTIFPNSNEFDCFARCRQTGRTRPTLQEGGGWPEGSTGRWTMPGSTSSSS